MRNFHLPGRSTVYGVNGMAASSQATSTLTAVEILKRGGNAIDAAVAACAVQCVVEPQSTSIGGDCFALLMLGGSGDVIGLNGSGRAPAAATFGWYEERGFKEIPVAGPHPVTVPGAIDAWARILADYGTMGLDQVLEPAIKFADEGFVIHPRVAHDFALTEERIRTDANTIAMFLPDGRLPSPGTIMRFPALAETMRRIARDGRDAFYLGHVAEDMVDYLQSLGGLHTLDDFAAQTSDYVTPIKTNYKGYDVFEIPPNGQGITALIMLNILRGFDLPSYAPLSVDRLHLETEATRLAYAARNAFVADMSQAEVPVAELLSEDYAAHQRARISIDRALDKVPAPDIPVHHDTVYVTVVDKDRNAVSFINSTFHGFGSGLVSPKTGISLHNRGSGFVVDPDHPNGIAPRKRPMHTIIPGMLVKDGKAQMPFGVMGGHYQPIGHTHVLTNMIDYGMDPQAAIDCPRVFHNQGVLGIEDGIDDATADGLAARGHQVARAPVPFGGGQAIWIDWERGVLCGGSEPRKDGIAIGF
jgi:gamma-glutamyltranspeptidase/glutathione hydrolase